jgi:hypothetical protein
MSMAGGGEELLAMLLRRPLRWLAIGAGGVLVLWLGVTVAGAREVPLTGIERRSPAIGTGAPDTRSTIDEDLMTTKVIIVAPPPGHRPLRVQAQTRMSATTDEWTDSGEADAVSAGGCSREYYVHDTMRLVVEETPGA